jgi:uncharacterized protein
MPIRPTYPGVYVEEIPSGVHTITGVSTSVTAFVGRAWKGSMDKPVIITSLADLSRKFGGLWRKSTMSYAVEQFFLNGGTQAIIVRVATRTGADTASKATIDLGDGNELEAANEGTWGRNLVVTIDHTVKDTSDTNLFNLYVVDNNDPNSFPLKDAESKGGSGQRETFLNVSRDQDSPRYVTKVLENQSELIRFTGVGADRPIIQQSQADDTTGGDGVAIIAADVDGDSSAKTGIYALKDADIFNLLCIPPLTPGETGNDISVNTWSKAATFCEENRAMLIVDAPNNWKVDNVDSAAPTNLGHFSAITRKNAAIYFPRLKLADSLQEGKLESFAPDGVMAGLISRIDATRGVWKAPAGTEANLKGVIGLGVELTDQENGILNPKGINCFRNFPGIGIVSWGGRTMEGQDILASEWNYLPIRRLALYIEESLFRGTKWVVFEPNDEPLWAKIRLNVGAFMMRLFREGAFQGSTPDTAFFVKCDSETTPQADRDLGIVNIVVGFAPLKPAEFVIIKIQQIAGEL